MSSERARTAWGIILHHAQDGIVELRWLPGQMTDGAFKAVETLEASLAQLAAFAQNLRPFWSPCEQIR